MKLSINHAFLKLSNYPIKGDKYLKRSLVLLISIISLHLSCLSQEITTIDSISSIPSKYFKILNEKADKIERKIEHKSDRLLHKLEKEEGKLKRRMQKIDSVASINIFKGAEEKFSSLKTRLASKQIQSAYVPHLDSLLGSVKFLKQGGALIGQVKELQGKAGTSLGKLNSLQEEFNKAEEINRFIKERSQYLSEQIQKFGLIKDFKKYNASVYYYSEQIREYKEVLSDETKIEKKVLELLSRTTAFKNFMSKNCLLASLFRIPNGQESPPTSVNSIVGIPMRSSVMESIQNSIGEQQGEQLIQQNIQQAQPNFNSLKDRLNQMASGLSKNAEMPDFKPNNQKTKSFLKRLEYSFNIQTQKKTYFFPVTTDIGMSIGYKINDKSVSGFGLSYKMGLGESWSNIKMSHQGIGIRSFIDIKLKGNFWLSGGYEINYRKEFEKFSQLRTLNAWQHSGLLGISKIMTIKSLGFKKSKIQLLWDLMSYWQVPKTQPILFRIGYTL